MTPTELRARLAALEAQARADAERRGGTLLRRIERLSQIAIAQPRLAQAMLAGIRLELAAFAEHTTRIASKASAQGAVVGQVYATSTAPDALRVRLADQTPAIRKRAHTAARKAASKIRIAIGQGDVDAASSAAAGQILRAGTEVTTSLVSAARDVAIASWSGSDTVSGWIWSGVCDDRECADCLVQQGMWFPDSVDFSSHGNCRCIPEPSDQTRAPLSGVDVETGTEVWTSMSPPEQARIVGKTKARLIRGHRIALQDTVVQTAAGRREATIEQALANARARRSGPRVRTRKRRRVAANKRGTLR